MTSNATRSPSIADAAPDAAQGGVASVVVSPRTAWAAAAVWLVIFILTFWDFFRAQFVQAVTAVQDWGHTLIIPFISEIGRAHV